MANVEIELNYEAVGELLKSEAMQSVLKHYARQLSLRTGEEVEAYVGQTRANVSVHTSAKKED